MTDLAPDHGLLKYAIPAMISIVAGAITGWSFQQTSFTSSDTKIATQQEEVYRRLNSLERDLKDNYKERQQLAVAAALLTQRVQAVESVESQEGHDLRLRQQNTFPVPGPN